ncbi:MAG: DUF4349 domain-containing protein [Candidatus Limivicinus sp.]|jgi:hypothetical protein
MKKGISLVLAVLMLLSLCACGANSEAPMRCEEAAPAECPMPEMEMMDEGAVGLGAAGGNGVTGSHEDMDELRPDKIIYSAEATVETADFDSTVAAVVKLAEEHKGFIESSSVNGSNYYEQASGQVSRRRASYVLRVPSRDFDLIMGSLSTLGNVPYSYTYTDNITSQYYDTGARLEAYQTQEARLLEMMEKAETVADTIAIEDKLTELRYEIERLQSTMKNWDRELSYSTISLEIQEVEEYTPPSLVQPKYGEKLLNALEDGLAAVGRFFSGALIVIVSMLPALIVIAVITVIIVLIVKHSRKKRRARRAANMKAAAAQIPPTNQKPEKK